jgi:hypothetical protein
VRKIKPNDSDVYERIKKMREEEEERKRKTLHEQRILEEQRRLIGIISDLQKKEKENQEKRRASLAENVLRLLRQYPDIEGTIDDPEKCELIADLKRQEKTQNLLSHLLAQQKQSANFVFSK